LDSNAQKLASFTDVRELQRQLKAQGSVTVEADESTTGPASFVAVDPDGNPILLDHTYEPEARLKVEQAGNVWRGERCG